MNTMFDIENNEDESNKNIEINQTSPTVVFKNCKYNQGNKGPSKSGSGFTLTLSTNPDDWFVQSNCLLCNGFKVEGKLFGDKFVFSTQTSKSYELSFPDKESVFTATTPQQLLKDCYRVAPVPKDPTWKPKSLSSGAMLVYGSVAIQKIASLLSQRPIDPHKLKQFNDDYFESARETLDDFIDDLNNGELKESYKMCGDWSWDKKTKQRRGKNKKPKQEKSKQEDTNIILKQLENNDKFLKDFEKELEEEDMVSLSLNVNEEEVKQTKKRKKDTIPDDSEHMKEQEIAPSQNSPKKKTKSVSHMESPNNIQPPRNVESIAVKKIKAEKEQNKQQESQGVSSFGNNTNSQELEKFDISSMDFSSFSMIDDSAFNVPSTHDDNTNNVVPETFVDSEKAKRFEEGLL